MVCSDIHIKIRVYLPYNSAQEIPPSPSQFYKSLVRDSPGLEKLRATETKQTKAGGETKAREMICPRSYSRAVAGREPRSPGSQVSALAPGQPCLRSYGLSRGYAARDLMEEKREG